VRFTNKAKSGLKALPARLRRSKSLIPWQKSSRLPVDRAGKARTPPSGRTRIRKGE